MAKNDLSKIKRYLKDADMYQKEAEKTAEKVGDKEGAERIKRARKSNKEALDDFPDNDNKKDF